MPGPNLAKSLANKDKNENQNGDAANNAGAMAENGVNQS